MSDNRTPKKPAAAKKATAKKAVTPKPKPTSAELPAAKRPIVTFLEDGTVVIENMPPTQRGRQSDYSRAQQLVIEELTKQVGDLQKRLNGLTNDYEGAKEGFDRAQRWHRQKEEENSRTLVQLHQQIAQGTSIGAANSFVIRTTQLLTESFENVQLIKAETGFNPSATWQIGELQLSFTSGRSSKLKAISTENAEEQINEQTIPLGHNIGELTATSISFIRDLLRAITHKGKKKLCKQSAYANWFPSSTRSPSPSHASETPITSPCTSETSEQHSQPDEQTIRNIGAAAMRGIGFDFESLMSSLDGQSHHRTGKDVSAQDKAAQATDSLSRGRLKTFTVDSDSDSKRRISAVLDVMASSQDSLIEILRRLYILAELMPINGVQPDEDKVNAVKHTLETASEQQLMSILPTAILGMLGRVNSSIKSTPRA